MKKALLTLMCLTAMMVASTSLKAQEVTIVLMPGYTWISIPSVDTLDFATALGSFTPMAGDVIKSQWGNAFYRNGQWYGNITQFFPGYGYHYYSNRTMPVLLTFNVQQPTPQVMVTTSEPTDITTNSATCGGNVASSNGDYVSVTLRGICWSTNPNPTFNDNYIEAGNGLGSFTVSMTELTPGITYYVRACAVTADGTYYGEQKTFVTSQAGVWIDLGLPSGLLWATCNVGADAPEEYGDYFAWGETQPKDTYNWNTYQYCNGTYNTLTKYCNNSSYSYNGFTDNLTTLLPEDDAATANWGSDWRMPTQAEFQELLDNTTVTLTTQNGVNGHLFTASNGNSLFLPAAGYYYNSGFNSAGSNGFYWSSSLYTDYPDAAWNFSSGFNMSGYSRYYGFTVRPVRSSGQNTSYIIDATANPAEGGVISGRGSYFEGTECTLTATANEGYTFSNWTENGEVVSSENPYIFTVTDNRVLEAVFTTNIQTTFTRVTSASGLEVGANYLIVGHNDELGVLAMGYQRSNNRNAVAVNEIGDVISVTIGTDPNSETDVFQFTLGGSADAWTFFDEVKGGYLYAGSSTSNQLMTQTTLDANGQWSITFNADGTAEVVAQGENERNNMRFNPNILNGDPRFGCYHEYSRVDTRVSLYKAENAVRTY